MSRHKSEGLKGRPRRVTHRMSMDTLGLRDPNTIQMRLRKHEIGAKEAIRLLERTDTQGRCLAGQLCIEQAYKSADVENKAELLSRAKDNFEAVSSQRHVDGRITSHHARALLNLAQLPNHAYIAATDRLPHDSIAKMAYEATLEAAIVTAKAFRTAQTKRDSQIIELSGLAAEASVVLLGQRTGIQKIGSESWFPTWSLYSEDHGNRHGGVMERSWDVSVREQLEDEPHRVASKLQVKSSLLASNPQHTSAQTDITVLYLRSDLALHPNESVSCTAVISELAQEAERGEDYVVSKLDARGELFLDKINE